MTLKPVSSRIVRIVRIAVCSAAAGLVVGAPAVAAPPQPSSPQQQARPLNPQPLPPRWGGQPGAVARPAAGVETGIIIVGGRPARAPASGAAAPGAR